MSVYRTIGPLVFEMYQKRVVLKKEGSEVWCLDSNQLFHILFVKSLSRFCRRKYLVSSYFTICEIAD